MTNFYLLAVLLVVIALLWILWPLVRHTDNEAPQREAANLDILKDQLSELDADRHAAILSEQNYTVARAELERRVLQEAAPATVDDRHSGTPFIHSKYAAVFLALVIPLGCAGLYALLGSPNAIVNETRAEQQLSPEQVENMIAQLAKRMTEHPEDVKGWGILARGYYAMGRYAEAAQAYEQLLRVAAPSADLLADYADALAMAQGGDLRGRPVELLHQALQLDAVYGKALLLLGGEAFERKDYPDVLKYWQPLLAGLPSDDELAQRIHALVDEARMHTSQSEPTNAKASASLIGIRGTVSIAPALLAQADPEDTVFVFARAATGPKMPLAVLRLKAKQLPIAFELNDGNAMRPDRLLSQQTAVIVGARLSKADNPLPQTGDLEGYSATLKPGGPKIQLVIDRRIP